MSSISIIKPFVVAASFLLGYVSSLHAQGENLAASLKNLDTGVIVRGKVRMPPLASMLARDVEARLRDANRADTQAFEKVKTRADWEAFRDVRLKALRASLGDWPTVPKDLKVRVTGSHEGDGYRIDNLVFESKPGVVVTANLYRPSKPTASMPAIVIVHSHNSSKHNAARQDMGMTWARAGCLVLIPDHLGHGERRNHPFGAESSYDYHGRYDLGIQLHLVGESLMGWLVWDLMRGVDVLLAQKGVDPKRLIMISEPAGGGDVGAVTAALDPRIACVLVQNFGGPQPETAYPLPRDAEHSFNYAGSGSWESTRSLRLSARDGFLPWTIVASMASRRLIYYHEFYWDELSDPAWKRIRRGFELGGRADSIRGLAGSGFVVGSPPENTHWLAINREIVYPVLEHWFKIPNPKKEYSNRRPLDEFTCLTPEAAKEYKPQPAHALAAQLGADRLAGARGERAKLKPFIRRIRLQEEWARLLGNVTPEGHTPIMGLPEEPQRLGSITMERFQMRTEPGILVPVILLMPTRKQGKAPIVVCLAQEGKQEFLKRRAGQIAELLTAGVAVVLLDVRGTGETDPGGSRGRGGPASSTSASEWMLGQSLLAGRVRDLRAVLNRVKNHPNLDGSRVGLWGDSFAPMNPPDRDLKVPHNAANRPAQSEPLGGLLALLGALFDNQVHSVYINGGLSDYASALESPLVYLPHDVVIPGVLTVSDLTDVAAALAPRPLWIDGMVDGHNRAVRKDTLVKRYAPTLTEYGAAGRSSVLRLGEQPAIVTPAGWFVTNLR